MRPSVEITALRANLFPVAQLDAVYGTIFDDEVLNLGLEANLATVFLEDLLKTR